MNFNNNNLRVIFSWDNNNLTISNTSTFSRTQQQTTMEVSH